jgi:non-ribosomal peptide synthetase component E (peptide arylation enzyme)
MMKKNKISLLEGVKMSDRANELANKYPVTMEEAQQYIDIDNTKAESACEIRKKGIDHEDTLNFLKFGKNEGFRFTHMVVEET